MVETPRHDDDEPVEGAVAPLGNVVQETERPPTRAELVAALKEIDPQEGPTAEHGKMVGLWLDERGRRDNASEDPIRARVNTQLELAAIYSDAGGLDLRGKRCMRPSWKLIARTALNW